MTVVLDASAAVRIVRDEGPGFVRILEFADSVVAPDLIHAEVCSAVSKYLRAGHVSPVGAEKTLHRALNHSPEPGHKSPKYFRNTRASPLFTGFAGTLSNPPPMREKNLSRVQSYH